MESGQWSAGDFPRAVGTLRRPQGPYRSRGQHIGLSAERLHAWLWDLTQGEPHAFSMRAIAAYWQVDRKRIPVLIKKLVEQGLVERTEHLEPAWMGFTGGVASETPVRRGVLRVSPVPEVRAYADTNKEADEALRNQQQLFKELRKEYRRQRVEQRREQLKQQRELLRENPVYDDFL